MAADGTTYTTGGQRCAGTHKEGSTAQRARRAWPLLAALAVALAAARWPAWRPLRSRLPLCGGWCDDAREAGAACELDARLTPCAGGRWCESTCGAWALYRLGDPLERPVPCETFAQAGAYARGGLPCAPGCLPPEVSPARYPAPTGLGFFCDPGTCNPPVQARYARDPAALARGMRVLQCPCQWFAADCAEGREPVRAVRKGAPTSASDEGLQLLRLEVGAAALRRLLDGHRPGGAVRIVRLEADGALREQPFALALPDAAAAAEEGEEAAYLEVLSSPVRSDDGLHPSVTLVARGLRALPPGRSALGGGGSSGSPELFAHPTVGGFQNRRYAFLLDALEGVRTAYVVATGSGLFGAASAVGALEARVGEGGLQRVHVLYGLRGLEGLPPEVLPLLAGWARGGARGAVSLTLVLSGGCPSPPDGGALPEADAAALLEAARRGERLRALSSADPAGRFHVQHALEAALGAAAARAEPGAGWRSAAVVGCSRTEVLDALGGVWERALCGPERGAEGDRCRALAAERVFTNV